MKVHFGSPLFNATVIFAFIAATWIVFDIFGLFETVGFQARIAGVLGTLLVPTVVSIILTGLSTAFTKKKDSNGAYFITTFAIVSVLTILGRVNSVSPIFGN